MRKLKRRSNLRTTLLGSAVGRASPSALMPPLEVLAWILLLLLLLRIFSKLTDLHTLLFSDAPPPPRVLRVPAVLLRKAWVFAHGIVYLFLSGDKVSSARLKGHPNADELENVTKEVRIIFVRHGESIWNLVFNRGKKSSGRVN